uniref:Importin N-terminal domain-containing protein n=1 Tax=Strigamia maritima TaxID=126957 RepID=T1JNU9_STRMM
MIPQCLGQSITGDAERCIFSEEFPHFSVMVKNNSNSAQNLSSKRSSLQSAACKPKNTSSLILRSDLISLLFKSKSGDRSESQAAATTLDQNLQNDFQLYVRILCDVLCDRTNGISVRQAAGVELRNAITCDEPFKRVECHQRWLLLSKDRRLYIKTNILSTLLFEGVKLVGSCVAGIACAEFPRDECNIAWKQYRFYAMKLQVKYGRGWEILNQNYAAIVEAVTAGITHGCSDKVKLASIKALVELISWNNHYFDNKEQRKVITHVIAEAAQSDIVPIKIAALRGLIEIVPRYYEYSDYCVDQLMLCTIASETMKSENYEARVKGIEFCNKLCFLEESWNKEPSRHFEKGEGRTFFSKTALNQFLPILLHLLCTLESWGVKTDEEENCKLLVHCLTCLVREGHVRKCVFMFAQKFVKSSLLTEDLESTLQLPAKTMPTLIRLMNDTNESVRVAAALVIRKTCDQVQDRSTFEEHLNGLTIILLEKLNDTPKVAIQVFESIAIAAKELEENNVEEICEANPLTKLFKPIANKLLDVMNSKDEKLRWAAHHALNVIISYRPMNCYCDLHKLTSVVLKYIQATKRQILSHAPHMNFTAQLSLWCLNFKMFLSRLKSEDARPLCASIMYNLAQILNSTNLDIETLDENIYWTMAYFLLGDSFMMYSGAFKPLIFSGLRNKKNNIAGAAALTHEVSVAMGYKFLPNFEEIVPIILDIFQNNYELESSVNEMHKWFLKAYVSIMQSSKNDRKLMETLIRQLKPCLGNMIQVISHIALGSFPIYDYTCIEVLFNLCTHFGKTVFHLLDTQTINNLLERGRNSENSKTSKLNQNQPETAKQELKKYLQINFQDCSTVELIAAFHFEDEFERLEQQHKWLSLHEHIRVTITKNIIRSLGTERLKPNSAAKCVAAIACAEFPHNQWPEVLSVLRHNDLLKVFERCWYVMEYTAILYALQVDLTAKEKQLILVGICDCAQSSNDDIRIAALKCLSATEGMKCKLFKVKLQAIKLCKKSIFTSNRLESNDSITRGSLFTNEMNDLQPMLAWAFPMLIDRMFDTNVEVKATAARWSATDVDG